MRNLIFLLFIILVLLNIFDVISTHIIISNGGYEVNSIMRQFMEIFGVVPAMIIWKGIVLTALFILIFFLKSQSEKRLFVYSVIAANVVYTYFMYTENFRILLMIMD